LRLGQSERQTNGRIPALSKGTKGQIMKRNATILTLLAGLILQIGCGEKRGESNLSHTKALKASAMAVRYESIPEVVDAPGTVQARNRISLSSQINGFVRDISVRVGDTVKPDQVLATLDARDAENQKAFAQGGVAEAEAALLEARKAYQAALDRQAAAKASMQLAEQTFNRYQKLFESRSASPQEMDEVRSRRDASAAELSSSQSMVAAAQERIKQVEARISQAKAQAGRADVMLSWTQIKAPTAGRVVERHVDAGTAIFPGTPLIVIESTSRAQVLADLPTEYVHRLKPGLLVRLGNPDAAGTIEGRVAEIVPQANPATHSVQFKVDLPTDSTLPNGQFVKVSIPTGVRNAILVPRSAIRENGQITGLFVVDKSSKARFRLVKIAPYDAEHYEVLSGIEPGENILTQLNNDIIDGIPVEIMS
jgi:multidrug efflux pump subunit AcrA (membrane-fusion protein)